MTEDCRISGPNELSDAELDSLLASADDNLMDYIRTNADSQSALLEIMGGRRSHPSVRKPPSGAAAVLRMRTMARGLAGRLDSDIGLAMDLLSEIGRAEGRARMVAFALQGSQDQDANSIHQLAVVLYRELAVKAAGLVDAMSEANRVAHDLMDRAAIYADEAHAVSAEFAEVVTRALRGFTVLSSHLAQAHALAQDLGREIAGQCGSGQKVTTEVQAQARELGDLYGSLRSQVRAVYDLHLAIALNPVRELKWIEVDASGVNLCHTSLDLDALEGVIWTRDTEWPGGLARKVLARSDEISPGIYKVQYDRRSKVVTNA